MLAADTSGRVYLLDQLRLLTGLAPNDRGSFAPFDLAGLGSSRARLEDPREKVVPANLWANWCGPCRAELPARDRLRRSVSDSGFGFVTLNEDIETTDAVNMLLNQEVRPPGGALHRHHHPGWPSVTRRGSS